MVFFGCAPPSAWSTADFKEDSDCHGMPLIVQTNESPSLIPAAAKTMPVGPPNEVGGMNMRGEPAGSANNCNGCKGRNLCQCFDCRFHVCLSCLRGSMHPRLEPLKCKLKKGCNKIVPKLSHSLPLTNIDDPPTHAYDFPAYNKGQLDNLLKCLMNDI
jgi:hypothetical protein